jgi:protein TonB
MDLLELLYIALGTIGILIVLHLGTFWVARVMQPPKPKIVYVQAPPAPPPPPPPPVLSQPPTTIQLPTYDTAPTPPKDNQVAQLPPPIETRSTTKQSGGDIGAPR